MSEVAKKDLSLFVEIPELYKKTFNCFAKKRFHSCSVQIYFCINPYHTYMYVNANNGLIPFIHKFLSLSLIN